MEDDHVDRPGVEAQQWAQLTGTNRSTGLIALIINVHQDGRSEKDSALGACPIRANQKLVLEKPFCHSPAWWLRRGVHTRSHLELGRKSPQRQWYFVSRRGRVGRRQACK